MQIYTTFYCRINEPSYIKFLKLDILAAIADETNAYDIATELTEYVNDIDEKLARKAIRTVGKIALEACFFSLFYNVGMDTHGSFKCKAHDGRSL